MPHIKAFFDTVTGTVSYLVWDSETRAAAIIDPVLDYEPHSASLSTGSADTILSAARELDLDISWVLETHAHADHLTAAHQLLPSLHTMQIPCCSELS